jgi:hypothetical protein
LVPTVRIEKHQITEGVSRLYVCGYTHSDRHPEYVDFRDSPCADCSAEVGFLAKKGKSNFTPILQLSPDYLRGAGNGWIRIKVERKNYYVVPIFGVVESGKGLVVVDGTGLILGNNTFNGNQYDWNLLYGNILNFGKPSNR